MIKKKPKYNLDFEVQSEEAKPKPLGNPACFGDYDPSVCVPEYICGEECAKACQLKKVEDKNER